jgi:hypothetical protein
MAKIQATTLFPRAIVAVWIYSTIRLLLMFSVCLLLQASLLLLSPLLLLVSLLLLLVRDVPVPVMSAVAGVPSVARTHAVVSVPAAFACP